MPRGSLQSWACLTAEPRNKCQEHKSFENVFPTPTQVESLLPSPGQQTIPKLGRAHHNSKAFRAAGFALTATQEHWHAQEWTEAEEWRAVMGLEVLA